jgi:pimeloyl-ACP methyl ester carboxylesterase
MSACAHGGRRPIGKSREVFGCRARCFRPAAVPNGRQAHVRWSSISFSIERLARPERLAEVSPAILPPPDAPVVMVSGVLDRLVPPYVAHDYARAQRGKPGGAVRLVNIPEAGHFDLVTPGTPAWEEVRRLIEAALGIGSPARD